MTRPLNFNDSGKNISGLNISIINNTDKCVTYTTACVINVILSITAVFGNSVIFITIWKTSSLHSAANILLSSLAVSDLAVGLTAQPLFSVKLLCGIHIDSVPLHILIGFLTIASFMSITAIGVDRLLALQLHLRYEAVVSPFRVKLVLIFILVLSGVVASCLLWVGKLFYTFPSLIFICLLVVNLVVYLKIYLIVRRHQRQIQQQQPQQQQQQQWNNENIFIVT